jgi:hypothetical protein
MTCAVCRRGAHGFGWFDPRYGIGDPRRFREPSLALLAHVPEHLPSEARHD